jgi:hypothetical protein
VAPDDLPVLPLADAPIVPPATRRPRPVRFPCFVSKDPDRLLKGLWDADLSDDGLRLSRPRNPEVWIPVGRGTARYLGGNQLAVRVRGREITLTIVRNGIDQVRLARDVAAFLNNERDPLDPEAYHIRRLIYVASLAPLGATVLALILHVYSTGAGVCGWLVLGVGTALLSLALLRRGAWSVRGRLIASVFPSLLAFAILGIAYSAGGAPPPPIEASQWRTVSIEPKDDPPFKVSMPGEPQPAVEFYGWWGDLRVLHLPKNGMSFAAGTLQPTARDSARTSGSPIDDRLNQQFRRMMPGATVKSDRTLGPMSSGGPNEGRELIIALDGPRGKGVLAVRIYQIKGRLYFLAVAGTHLEAIPLGADARKFLDSFQPPQGNIPFRGPAGGPPSPDMLPGLLVHWTFEEDQGIALGDYNNSAAEEGGVRGRALHVSGRNSSSFDVGAIGDRLDFKNLQAFTFVGWFRTTRSEATLLSFRSSRNSYTVIELTITGGGLRVAVHDDAREPRGAAIVVHPAPRVNDGEWHHFAFTRTSGTGVIKLYVDGALSGSTSDALNSDGGITTDLRTLGRRAVLGGDPVGETFEGWLDEVAVFSRALDADEIRKLAGR